jgi:hypothetical protein
MAFVGMLHDNTKVSILSASVQLRIQCIYNNEEASK